MPKENDFSYVCFVLSYLIFTKHELMIKLIPIHLHCTKSCLMSENILGDIDSSQTSSSSPSSSIRIASSDSKLPTILCNYSDSSQSEDESPSSSLTSPNKKRRKRRVISNQSGPGLEVLPLPLSEEGVLDVDQLFGNNENNFKNLDDALDKLLLGFKNVHLTDLRLPDDQISESTAQVELLNETFEVRPVVKRPRENWSDVHEEDDDNSVVLPSADPGPSEGDAQFLKPKLRNRKFIFKPFVRDPDGSLKHNDQTEAVDVIIPEQLAASYGLYIWPSSPVLSWFIWLHQEDFRGKTVLELGAGTSLPGLLCAKIGADNVWLADQATNLNVLDNCREAVKLNHLEDRVQVVGINWGSFEPDIFHFCHSVDFIIGSDLFFDPEVFEPLCVTLSFLLQKNPKAQVLITVQDRSEDWSIEEHFKCWKLRGKLIYPKEFLRGTGIDEGDLTGKHSIFIVQVSLAKDHE